MDESQLTLLLPTLNERDNIVPQINEVWQALPQLGEIIVVDDDSKDGTREAVAAAFPDAMKAGRLHVLHRTQALGLTNSLRDGIMAARGELVGWMDCDLSMPAPLLRKLLQKVSDGDDIAVGSRFLPGGEQKSLSDREKDSVAEIVLSNGLNRFLHWALKLPITDYTSGFVIARKSWLTKIQWRGHHGEYFFDFVLQADRQGAKISEVPYVCGTRKFGESKTFGDFKSSVRNSYRYGKAVIRVMYANFTGV